MSLPPDLNLRHFRLKAWIPTALTYINSPQVFVEAFGPVTAFNTMAIGLQETPTHSDLDQIIAWLTTVRDSVRGEPVGG